MRLVAAPMAHPTRLEVSLESLPPGERFAYWQEKGSLYFRPSLVHPSDRNSFTMHGAMTCLGPLVLIRCGGSRQIYRRDARTIADDRVDFVILDSLLEGAGIAWHGVSSCVVKPGDLLLTDLKQPSRFQVDCHERITASIPRVLLEDLFPEFAAFHGHLLPGSTPCAQALLAHLIHLEQLAADVGEAQAEPLAQGLMQLMTLFFRATAPGCGGPGADTLADSSEQQLRAILAYIDAHLSDSALCVSQLMSQFNLSRTALYRLFEPHGGVAEVIRERRLQIAYRLLLKPQPPGGRQPLIRDLALGLGFSSEAHFSRVFKLRFGVTARAVRQQTLRPPVAALASSLGDAAMLEASLDHYYQVWAQGLQSPMVPPRPL